MLDLRHLSNYNGSFSINKEWTVSLNFSSESSEVYSLFGEQFPEPGGFNISVDVPYFFSFMVNFFSSDTGTWEDKHFAAGSIEVQQPRAKLRQHHGPEDAAAEQSDHGTEQAFHFSDDHGHETAVPEVFGIHERDGLQPDCCANSHAAAGVAVVGGSRQVPVGRSILCFQHFSVVAGRRQFRC